MKEKNSPSLVDTHAHLTSKRFAGEADALLKRARGQGVDRIVTIACDREDSRAALELAEEREAVSATVGIHPLYVHEDDMPSALEEIRRLAATRAVAAVGEIGLDYYHPSPEGFEEAGWKTLQAEVFETQLQLAVDLSLPVVVHQRDSAEDVIATLRNFPKAKAVLHCFSGTREEAETFLSMGHWLSFTGILTFPSAESVREAAAIAPADRIMVETDSPYLAPVPFRGKTCEPSLVVHTAKKLAEVRGIAFEEVAETTTRNAERFFRGLA